MTELDQAPQLTGLLAGTGANVMRATVLTRPVPTQPPARLVELVSPVHDDDAQLLDWRLAPHHADQSISAEDIAAYRSWRGEFVAERFIGERSAIASLLDWVAGRCEVATLEVLRLPSARVDFHTALEMRQQLAEVSRLLNATDEHGYGLITTPGRATPSRVLIPVASSTALLAVADASLTLTSAGIQLRAPDVGPEPATVSGWQSDPDGVRAATGAGDVQLGQHAAARLLRVAGRHASQVEVAALPLATLIAPLLIFLRDAAELASSTNSDLYLRSTWA